MYAVNISGNIDSVNISGYMEYSNISGNMGRVNISGNMYAVNISGNMYEVNISGNLKQSDIKGSLDSCTLTTPASSNRTVKNLTTLGNISGQTISIANDSSLPWFAAMDSNDDLQVWCPADNV